MYKGSCFISWLAQKLAPKMSYEFLRGKPRDASAHFSRLRDRTRTGNLQVMSLASYHCSTPLYKNTLKTLIRQPCAPCFCTFLFEFCLTPLETTPALCAPKRPRGGLFLTGLTLHNIKNIMALRL